uniref:Vms1-associating treble clef domain-containing protein n=1 Tax=Aplanochytrium stocchinoi TaxID=215587 RepID=A0A7S3PI87_9STRA
MKAVTIFGPVDLESEIGDRAGALERRNSIPLVDVNSHIFQELGRENIIKRFSTDPTWHSNKSNLFSVDPHGQIKIQELAMIKSAPFLKLTNLSLDCSVEEAETEIRGFTENGGVVMCSTVPRGRGRDLGKLVELAEKLKSHLSIVVGTGWSAEYAADKDLSREELVRLLAGEVLDGLEEQQGRCKAGIIGEIVLSNHILDHKSKKGEIEAVALNAAVQAHVFTDGCPLLIKLEIEANNESHLCALNALERVINTFNAFPKAKSSKLAVSGLFSSLPGHLSFAEMNEYVSKLSKILKETRFNLIVTLASQCQVDSSHFCSVETVVSVVKELVRDGHGSRLMLGQNTNFKTQLWRYGGWGYSHLSNVLIPHLMKAGSPIDEFVIKQICIQNALEFLKFYTPPAAAKPREIEYWNCDLCGKKKPETYEAFEKSGYRYCSMKCLKKHKQILDSENDKDGGNDDEGKGRKRVNNGSTSWGIAVGSS